MFLLHLSLCVFIIVTGVKLVSQKCDEFHLAYKWLSLGLIKG